MTDTSKIVEYPAIAAPGVPYFTPHQDPPSGSAVVPQPDGKDVPSLFQPIKLRELQLQNKIIVREMICSGTIYTYLIFFYRLPRSANIRLKMAMSLPGTKLIVSYPADYICSKFNRIFSWRYCFKRSRINLRRGHSCCSRR